MAFIKEKTRHSLCFWTFMAFATNINTKLLSGVPRSRVYLLLGFPVPLRSGLDLRLRRAGVDDVLFHARQHPRESIAGLEVRQIGVDRHPAVRADAGTNHVLEPCDRLLQATPVVSQDIESREVDLDLTCTLTLRFKRHDIPTFHYAIGIKLILPLLSKIDNS